MVQMAKHRVLHWAALDKEALQENLERIAVTYMPEVAAVGMVPHLKELAVPVAVVTPIKTELLTLEVAVALSNLAAPALSLSASIRRQQHEIRNRN